MSRRRDWLIQDSSSLPVDAASRALRGDVDGAAPAKEPNSRLLAAEFIEHGYPDEGHRVVEAAAATRDTPGRLQVLTWLYGQATREADDKAAATWAEAIFCEALFALEDVFRL